MEDEFKEFSKIYRYSRECIITEKIDGTNAVVRVSDDLTTVKAGSRNGWTDGNFGWALWVEQHKEELKGLGPGFHYGEWWGSGIQRGYGLQKGEKRFSLFNVSRWSDEAIDAKKLAPRPACCSVVPVLWQGPFDSIPMTQVLDQLRTVGSHAAPGFMKPEGIVIFHVPSMTLFKKTLERDEEPKGKLR